jgi:uncharacterized phage protein (predicted DNA packaging)
MLEEVKQYLRIDGSEEDSFLASLIPAAKIYIKNATDINVNENDELQKLAVFLLVSHWYENRQVVAVGTISKELEFSLRSILIQMRYCDESSTV